MIYSGAVVDGPLFGRNMTHTAGDFTASIRVDIPASPFAPPGSVGVPLPGTVRYRWWMVPERAENGFWSCAEKPVEDDAVTVTSKGIVVKS